MCVCVYVKKHVAQCNIPRLGLPRKLNAFPEHTNFIKIVFIVLDQLNLINIFCFLLSTFEIAIKFDTHTHLFEIKCRRIRFEHWLEFNWIELNSIGFISYSFLRFKNVSEIVCYSVTCIALCQMHLRNQTRREKKIANEKKNHQQKQQQWHRKNVRQNHASFIHVREHVTYGCMWRCAYKLTSHISTRYHCIDINAFSSLCLFRCA